MDGSPHGSIEHSEKCWQWTMCQVHYRPLGVRSPELQCVLEHVFWQLSSPQFLFYHPDRQHQSLSEIIALMFVNVSGNTKCRVCFIPSVFKIS